MSDLEIEQKPSARVWVFAAVMALALHVGVALALVHLKADEADDDLGAPAIEIGLDMASPRVAASDLPPGPDTDASVDSPAQAEQQAEFKEAERPKDTPTEAEDPDRVVTPNETRKPVEEEKKIAPVETSASQQSVAAEATATPRSEAMPQGPRSVAPAQGTGDAARLRATWQKQLIAHLEKHKLYPEHGSMRVEIQVGFVLDRKGHVLSARVVKGSGDAAFDEAALAMFRRSDPVPQPPPLVADEGLNFTLPVTFKERGRS
ncbi:MAG TPA: energy transducer TonB [Bradyrhizobium sp.]|nr:energy transducer TonB [Bradyrhizobium sp.]